ncbi:MAG: GntR family transcriptional regulator [Actinobacteria bacterium]|nr:MAG: GntR family transcriptional regulator [Actinomycetota bacterium]REK40001.1 MAG: GntR family transcriptional regulator [Actinomycetota bacterium]
MTNRPNKNEIHAYLREQILLLDLPAGSRLREERLADHFGVSRHPIREVLDRLEFEGLVEQVPGAGARVSTLDTKALRDVWAVRLKIAEMVGDFVRLPVDKQLLERLQAIRSELSAVKKSRDIRALGALYNRYHSVMLEVVDNQALARIHDLLYVQTARVWMQFLPEMDFDTEIAVMREEVDDTIKALKGREGSELARIRVEHMRRLLQRFSDRVSFLPPDFNGSASERSSND